jgi:hypothetical protein
MISALQTEPAARVSEPSGDDRRAANLDRMADPGSGMDVIIVSTTSPHQEAYWQDRLERSRGDVTRRDAVIIVMCEDWPGGAGNGLGTLYALQEAANRARLRHGVDLLERLRSGASIGLYHTAGKGTRLAPLPAAEYNNKPGVRLPGLLQLDGETAPITILEAVIRQTGIYAQSRRGRLSVFWGDQVFIPSREAHYTPTHAVDILARIGPMPTAEQWRERGLETYGLIAVRASGDAAQVEKVTWAEATRLVASGVIGVEGGIGVSLGSFSLSAAFTEALLAEFAPELAARRGKMDTDPHFWMPLTLDRETYVRIRVQKKESAEAASAHYSRMQAFRARLPDGGGRLFGCVDIGADAYWWDYGQIRGYLENTLALTAGTAEAGAMRRFFRLPERGSVDVSGVDVDAGSVLIGCRIVAGRIRNSVLVGVAAPRVDVENAVVVGVAAPAIAGRGVLLYNVLSETPLRPADGTVRADVIPPDGEPLICCTDRSRDGGRDWYERLPGNAMSYDEIAEHNRQMDCRAATAAARSRFARLAARLFNTAVRHARGCPAGTLS